MKLFQTEKRIIPFKYQVFANVVKKCLTDLSSKSKTTIHPVFISRKLNKDLKVREIKPAIVNQQCLVYKFQCNLCDAYMLVKLAATTTNALIDTSKNRLSVCKHYFSEHNSNVPPCLLEHFHVLTKFFNKFDCLINEMLFIRKKEIIKVRE